MRVEDIDIATENLTKYLGFTRADEYISFQSEVLGLELADLLFRL